MLRTPLYDSHIAAGAKIVPFAGYEMPVQYPAGVMAEHLHTRRAAGLFDVSHMGQGFISGDPESLVPGDVKALKPGRTRYTLLLNETGGALDDLMISRLPDGQLFSVVNAACKEQDFEVMRSVGLVEWPDRALLALQGPEAANVLARILPDSASFAFMQCARIGDLIVTRSGYTGEDGFEISLPAEAAPAFWQRLLDQPEVKPIGLGARDSLRLEAGLCLYGHELDPSISPIEADLAWTISKRRREAGGFPGAERILRELRDGPSRKRVGIRPDGRAPAREGTEIVDATGRVIGRITSGGFGPSLDAPIAMGMVEAAHAEIGTALGLVVRGKTNPARVVPLPSFLTNIAVKEGLMRKFTKDHEWISLDGAVATVGITKFAQGQLGDVVYVELPAPGTHVDAGGQFAVVESVKAASEVYAPVAGTVVEVNQALTGNPATVNEAAEEGGWFAKFRIDDPASLSGLMDEAAYQAYVAELGLMRYLPLTEADRRDMLATIGVTSIDALFRDVPESARRDAPVDLPHHQGEIEVERALSALAAKNLSAGAAPFFIGAGAYRHHIPAAVDHLIQRSEFLTSYTPYQPEIAQGTLQYLFEFQTQVALLTGMDIANASMYDGSTACAEAVLMAGRVTRRTKAVISGGLHPHYRAVIETIAGLSDEALVIAPPAVDGTEDLIPLIDSETACVVIQTPSFFGHLHDVSRLSEAAHAKGALVIVVVTEVVSLGLLTPPGEMGADIVVAEGQSLGNGLNFGGPYVGLFATREKYLRQMPGRLAGETVDADGKRGFVLTLSTREQHIRRDKATSNICTNSGLCALAFTMHLTLLGEAGLTRLAELNHEAALALAEEISSVPGVALINQTFFNEFTLRLPKPAGAVVDALAARGILGGLPVSRLIPGLDNLLVVAATETNSADDIDRFATALREVLA